MKLSIAAALAAGAFLVTMQPVSAVTQSCADAAPPDSSGAVTVNIGCEVSDTLGPSQPTLGEVNLEGFFGISNWDDLGKIEADGGAGTDGKLTITGTNINDEGDWKIEDFDASYTYMLLFKDGNNKEPGLVIGYLVNQMSGTFSQMFYNDTGLDGDGNPTFALAENAISNIRLLAVIPVPAGALLIGTAFVAAGAVSARARARRKAA